MKRPNRYPYSGKRRIFEKTILRVGYINASNIKSNNSTIKSNNSTITFRDEKIVVNGEDIRLNEGWSNEQRKDLCSL